MLGLKSLADGIGEQPQASITTVDAPTSSIASNPVIIPPHDS